MERVPFNEDSGRFPILVDMERPEDEFDHLLGAIAKVGEQIDKEIAEDDQYAESQRCRYDR